MYQQVNSKNINRNAFLYITAELYDLYLKNDWLVGKVIPLHCLRNVDGQIKIVAPDKTETLFANIEMLMKAKVDLNQFKEKVITFSMVLFYI